MRALEGILVVAVEQAVAAPLCSCRLADAGARVIKVERPEGDFARGYDSVARGESAYFVWLNRGKESVALDIKDEADRGLLLRLLARADVLVQNLKPGGLRRAGIDISEVRQRNPGLVVCRISGFGPDGPNRDRKAYDLLIQAESGLAALTGTPSEAGRTGVSVCDVAAGMYAYEAILEALIARGRSGEGAEIEVSLFDAMADWMTVPLLHYDYGGRSPGRAGLRHPSIAPYGVFETSDGRRVLISIQNEREWRILCEGVLEKPAMAHDPRFAGNEARVANRPALDSMIAEVFANLSRDALVARLLRFEIAYGDLNEVGDLSAHPTLRRLSVATPHGEVAMPAPPARTRGAGIRPGPVPALGAHTEKIRREFAEDAPPQ